MTAQPGNMAMRYSGISIEGGRSLPPMPLQIDAETTDLLPIIEHRQGQSIRMSSYVVRRRLIDVCGLSGESDKLVQGFLGVGRKSVIEPADTLLHKSGTKSDPIFVFRNRSIVH